MSDILRDRKAGPMLLIGASVGFGGLFWLVLGEKLGIAVLAIGVVTEVLGPYLHDRHTAVEGRSRMPCGVRVIGTSRGG